MLKNAYFPIFILMGTKNSHFVTGNQVSGAFLLQHKAKAEAAANAAKTCAGAIDQEANGDDHAELSRGDVDADRRQASCDGLGTPTPKPATRHHGNSLAPAGHRHEAGHPSASGQRSASCQAGR